MEKLLGDDHNYLHVGNNTSDRSNTAILPLTRYTNMHGKVNKQHQTGDKNRR